MCNCKTKCGCNIAQTTKGEKGDSGINAFKFVKEFEYDGSTPLSIPYSEITDCNSIPEGCYASGDSYNAIVDYHVQIWKLIVKPGSPTYWTPFTGFDYAIDLSGDVLISGTAEAALYRLVILA